MIISSFALVLSLSSCADSSTPVAAQSVANATTATLNVDGMTCKSCENAIRRALLKLPGVSQAAPSHQQKVVVVTFDVEKISLDKIKEAITELGYEIK